MDVTEYNWVSKATDNIDKYLHRGGDGKGNEPQLLGGTDLANTIGIALGLPLSDPTTWSEYELQQAESANLCFFKGTAREAIDNIIETIKDCCNGDETNFITVIPIELHFNNKLYELPIFKVQRYRNSTIYYVDNIGRYYSSFRDWNNNNKLPPCKIIYPKGLELVSNGNHTAVTPPYDTPVARVENKVVEGVDIAAGVIGIGSAVGLMILSGPFAPVLAIAGGASAIWGTTRAVSELVDRGDHGQTIDPFKDETARMLWLGVAANIAGFGAMGVSMRVSAVAARGIQLSNALKVFTNVVNGVSLTLNSVAIINNTVYLVQHIKEMSAGEILLNLALLAFWTKGTFTFKRASVIIKEAHNQAFARITQELTPSTRAEFAEVRSRVQNDENLLHLFHTAHRSNISTSEFSHLMIDGMHYYDNVARLNPEQMEAFLSLRNYLQDDLRLLSGLQRFSQASHLDRESTLELVLTLWQRYTSSPSRGDTQLINSSIVLGNAPPIKITEMPQLSSSLIRFVGEHLSKVDTSSMDQWSIRELLSFQDHGLFTVCPVTAISKTGHSTIALNGKLQISLRKLQSIPIDSRETMFKMIGELKPEHTITSSKLPTDVVKLCVRQYRLRFEVHRKESLEWARGSVTQENLINILNENLLPHEKDRLYTFKTEVNMMKADVYMNDMMKFVSEMNPKNVSEMVAYSEFAMTYVDETSANIEASIRNGTTKLPHNAKKTVWLRQQAKEKTFHNTTELKQKLNDFMKIVDENDMVGVQVVPKGLPDEKLVEEIRALKIKFGGRASAAYHIYKHSTEPLTAYVDQANSTIRSPSSSYAVSIGQEGDSRIISFTDANGSGIVLEKDGRVLLASFRASHRK
ncbi:unnamed protein product [Pieris macdunnoughi]|uniref:DUF4781 domain-containing protein n=1 Tax=Pieris macdunnoughi TaxID=345717 RepID=A0A821VGD9_9NEOP|nr:unnamed protein product [Pieris macdunnoughi]